MTPEENVTALRRESAALAQAARKALAPMVPSCPEWSVSDLVWHVGGIHRHRIWLITEHPYGPSGFDIERPSDDAIAEWFLDGAEKLSKVLEQHDASEKVWTWFPPDQSVGFWQRRMAQETAVHRWDGEDAVGDANEIEPWLAADGIAEFFDTLMVVQDEPQTGNGETVHVHATDTPAEWVITLAPEGARAEPTHAKGDAAIRGKASDVLLALWRRIPLDRVEVLGDRALADRFVGGMDLS
ncbi:MAG TPA: maleylpyruvate isomerase family mycothiol-dependent enzyme [Actinomycetota bacterium]|nr:maleylpyruvate isomerase family mycothiol-dependent enzyme [Actinomycetota bacterium]